MSSSWPKREKRARRGSAFSSWCVSIFRRSMPSTASPKAAQDALDFFARSEPRLAATLRASISPNIVQGGYRVNVIPSEAKATLDVRLMPDEDPARFLETIRGVVDDPAVEVAY